MVLPIWQTIWAGAANSADHPTLLSAAHRGPCSGLRLAVEAYHPPGEFSVSRLHTADVDRTEIPIYRYTGFLMRSCSLRPFILHSSSDASRIEQSSCLTPGSLRGIRPKDLHGRLLFTPHSASSLGGPGFSWLSFGHALLALTSFGPPLRIAWSHPSRPSSKPPRVTKRGGRGTSGQDVKVKQITTRQGPGKMRLDQPRPVLSPWSVGRR